VFNLRGDDVLGCTGGVADDTEDGVVIGFRASAGEHDFPRASAEERSDLFACDFNGGAAALAWRVDGSGVAEISREIRKHGVEDFRLDGSGGVVIEVGARHGELH